MSASHRLGLMLCALFISGCSTVTTAPPPAPVQPKTTVNSSATPALHQGRLSLTLTPPGETQPQLVILQFRLQGQTQEGTAELTGPLGYSVANIAWNTEGAQLIQGAQIQHFASLSDLTLQTLGERLPIAALPMWLQGQAAPQWPSTPLDSEQPQAHFEQQGWQVDARQLQSTRIVQAYRPAQGSQAEVRLRIKLDNP